MLFKIDENLPVEIAELLVQAGHDAKTANDQNLQGAHDPALLDVCRSEQRVLLTLDLDFSDIRTYPPQDNTGIIVLRVSSQSKPHLMQVIRRITPPLVIEPLTYHLWIVEENKVRIRGSEAEDKE
jgi:predicted nuclease of predicted toxin-antitoxin system